MQKLKDMKKHLLIIRSNIIRILIAGGLFYWGIANNGYIRISIAILIIFSTIESIKKEFIYVSELDNWFKENQGKLILFYPTEKLIQDKIKSDFIPKIPFKIMEVYYEGPKIIGHIKRSIVFELMRWNCNVKIHQPSILKIVDNSVIVFELSDLKRINSTKIDYQKLLSKIKKLYGI